MAWQPQPTNPGIYRVKVFNSGTDRYWKYTAGREHWIQLAQVNQFSVEYKWRISPRTGTNVFDIYPDANEGVGFTTSTDNIGKKYWGYGFAEGFPRAPSAVWNITPNNGQYSKIKIDGTSYVLDCRDTSAQCVHFYDDNYYAENQRWVFQFVEDL